MENPLAAQAVVDGETHPDQGDLEFPGQGVALAMADQQVRLKLPGSLGDGEEIAILVNFRAAAGETRPGRRLIPSPAGSFRPGFEPAAGERANCSTRARTAPWKPSMWLPA